MELRAAADTVEGSHLQGELEADGGFCAAGGPRRGLREDNVLRNAHFQRNSRQRHALAGLAYCSAAHVHDSDWCAGPFCLE